MLNKHTVFIFTSIIIIIALFLVKNPQKCTQKAICCPCNDAKVIITMNMERRFESTSNYGERQINMRCFRLNNYLYFRTGAISNLNFICSIRYMAHAVHKTAIRQITYVSYYAMLTNDSRYKTLSFKQIRVTKFYISYILYPYGYKKTILLNYNRFTLQIFLFKFVFERCSLQNCK
jgi:hypothetical protein